MGLVRRVHGGAVPAGSLTVIESGISERDQANTARQGGDRGRRRRPAAARPDSVIVHRRRQHHRPPRRRPPPRPPADRDHPRRARRGPARRAAPDRAAPAAGQGAARPRTPPSAPTRSPRSATSAPTSPSSATNGLTDRPRTHHSRPRRGGEPSGRSSPARRRTVVLADSTKIGVETAVRFADTRPTSTCWSPTATSSRRTRRALESGRTRGGGRMILTLTPNPSIDRTVDPRRRADPRRRCTGSPR